MASAVLPGILINQQAETFTDDAIAGVEYLKSRKEINPKQIGLIGHSEGGMIAQIAAYRSSDVAFIVMMAGPGIGFDEMVIFQVLEQLRLEGTTISPDALNLIASWILDQVK